MNFQVNRLIDEDVHGNLELKQRNIVLLNHTLKESLDDCILYKRPHCQWVSGWYLTLVFSCQSL